MFVHIYLIFASDTGKMVTFGKPNAVTSDLQNQTCSLSPSHSHLPGRDIAGMPLVAGEGEDPVLTGCAGLASAAAAVWERYRADSSFTEGAEDLPRPW